MNRKLIVSGLSMLALPVFGLLIALTDAVDTRDYNPKSSEMYNSQNNSIRSVEYIPSTQQTERGN